MAAKMAPFSFFFWIRTCTVEVTANKAIMCTYLVVMYMGPCALRTADACVRMCLWYCWYHSHGHHQSLADMGQMLTVFLSIDANKSEQLEVLWKRRWALNSPEEIICVLRRSLLGRVSASANASEGFRPSPSPLEMTVGTRKKASGHWSSLTLAASFPSEKSRIVVEEERREEWSPEGCMDNKFTIISPSSQPPFTTSYYCTGMETSYVMFGFMALAW